MGFSLVAEGLLTSCLPDAPWRPLITKFGYSIGFLIVVLGRQQLFTENTLTPILPLLQDRRLGELLNVLRLWVSVLVTNLIGALLFAWAFQRSSIFGAELKAVLLTLGEKAVEANWTTIFLRAIVAGWLIALMVWLLPVAETARVSVIVIITYLIGLGHFSHVIAGSVNVLYAVFAGSVSVGGYLGHFLAPALLGNIIGGVSLVAALNYAQVVSGTEEND
jgi:formate/nitrite transporter FocA (FNT family)